MDKAHALLRYWLQYTKPVMAVMVLERLDDAVPCAQALVKGGVHLLEITLRSGIALEAIALIKQAVPEAIVGAGTVTDVDEFERAIDAGAQFIVSPGSSDELFRRAQVWQARCFSNPIDDQGKHSARGVFLPGVATASDVMAAYNAGFKQMKCFPAEALGGVTLIKAWVGPFPDVCFCPTGGISEDNQAQYLALDNVICIGASYLSSGELLARQDWCEIERRARAL